MGRKSTIPGASPLNLALGEALMSLDEATRERVLHIAAALSGYGKIDLTEKHGALVVRYTHKRDGGIKGVGAISALEILRAVMRIWEEGKSP